MSHLVEHDLDPEELEALEQEEDVFGMSFLGSCMLANSRFKFTRVVDSDIDLDVDSEG